MDSKEEIIKQIDSYYNSWFEINNIYHAWAKRHDIDDTTLFVLYVIKNAVPYCTQSQICNKLFLPKQTISQTLAKLEKDGYIVKEINTEDLRNKIIKFTEKGTRFAIAVLEELMLAEVEAFSRVSHKHRMAIVESFVLLADSLGKSLK